MLELSGTVVGSDSACSRQGSATFLEIDSDNEMNGFAFFEDGFTLETVSTTCTFDSFFPVSGIVDMNYGTLYLRKDLKFDRATNLRNLGSVFGNGFSVEFNKNRAAFDSSWSYLDSNSWIANGPRSLDWSFDDAYLVFAGWNARTSLASFDGSTLTPINQITQSGFGRTVKAHPLAYYFATGSFNGDELTLSKISAGSLSLVNEYDTGASVFAVDWTSDGNYIAIGTASNTRVYSFAGEEFSSVATLALGADEAVTRNSLAWDPTNSYYVAGVEHTTNSKVRIYYFNGSTITEKTYVDMGTDIVEAVDWSPLGNLIAVGTDGSTNQVRVYEYNSGTDSLSLKTQIDVGDIVYSVHWNSDATVLLVGKDVHSMGPELLTYMYDQDSSTLTLDQEQECSTIIFAARWSHNDSYLAYVDLSKTVSLYSYDAATDIPDCILGLGVLDNVNFFLNNNMSWKMTATIQGDCTVDARNNRITLEDEGSMYVSSGAQLTLKNMGLAGLSGSKLSCEDNSASIILKNCELLLEDDFEFATGFLSFQQDIVISGTCQFTYASNQISTVSAHSKLTIDRGAKFYYAPSTANRDLLAMTDRSSCLYLDGCTLQSTTTGLRLTNGRLFIDNNVTFSSEGTTASESISFGNGSAVNDLDIKVLSGATLDLYGGLYYDNVE